MVVALVSGMASQIALSQDAPVFAWVRFFSNEVTSTKCFHIGREIQYAFTYIYIGVLGMKILIYLISNKLVRSCLLMSLR